MRRMEWVIVAVMLVAVAAAQAQPGFRGGIAGGQFHLATSADANAYYYVVQYAGDAVPEVETRLYGRALDIRISQAAGGPSGFFRNSLSRTFRLPPDADPSRMARRDERGSIVLVVPRWRPRPMPGW